MSNPRGNSNAAEKRWVYSRPVQAPTSPDRPGAVILGGDYLGLGIARSLGGHGIPICVIDDERTITRFSRFTTHSVRAADLHDERACTEVLLAAGRRLNFNAMYVRSATNTVQMDNRIEGVDYAASRGADVLGLLFPCTPKTLVNPLTTMVFNMLPNWAPVFSLPREQRKAAFADPAVRARLAEGMARQGDELKSIQDVGRFSIESVAAPEMKSDDEPMTKGTASFFSRE